jgi:hypothetical protein
MNRENLQKMADYIRTIPQDRFDMWTYRHGQEKTAECDSVACIIGHCTKLDAEPLPVGANGNIDFETWCDRFTELDSDNCWIWCFNGRWKYVDNTSEGAALRIEWLLKHGLPENWYEQLWGIEPLCYKGGEQ